MRPSPLSRLRLHAALVEEKSVGKKKEGEKTEQLSLFPFVFVVLFCFVLT